MKNWLLLGLAGLLLSCAPNMTSGGSWSRTVFITSGDTARQGCIAATTQPPGSYIGQKPFSSPNGAVNFMSTPGQVGVFCQIFSFGLQTQAGRDQYFASEGFKRLVRDANAYVVVYTKEDIRKVTLFLSLEDKDGKEFAQLRTSTVEGVLPGVRFDFDQLSPTDLINIEKTVSFTIVVNRGSGEEKFRITPSNLNPFSLNP